MGNLLNALGSDKDTQILLMAWADHHPYLFTLIQVTAPINWIIVAIAGFKIVSGVVAHARH